MRTLLSVVNEGERHEQLMQIGEDVLIKSHLLLSGCFQMEVTRKLVGGVRFLSGMRPFYDEEQLLHDLEQKGFFSARPFTVKRAYDPSIDACTAALFASFCHAHGLDSVVLFRQAYPPVLGRPFIDPPFPLMEQIAQWEGIVLPDQWRRTQFHHLLRLLTPQRKLANLLMHTSIGMRLLR